MTSVRKFFIYPSQITDTKALTKLDKAMQTIMQQSHLASDLKHALYNSALTSWMAAREDQRKKPLFEMVAPQIMMQPQVQAEETAPEATHVEETQTVPEATHVEQTQQATQEEQTEQIDEQQPTTSQQQPSPQPKKPHTKKAYGMASLEEALRKSTLSWDDKFAINIGPHKFPKTDIRDIFSFLSEANPTGKQPEGADMVLEVSYFCF